MRLISNLSFPVDSLELCWVSNYAGCFAWWRWNIFFCAFCLAPTCIPVHKFTRTTHLGNEAAQLVCSEGWHSVSAPHPSLVGGGQTLNRVWALKRNLWRKSFKWRSPLNSPALHSKGSNFAAIKRRIRTGVQTKRKFWMRVDEYAYSIPHPYATLVP